MQLQYNVIIYLDKCTLTQVLLTRMVVTSVQQLLLFTTKAGECMTAVCFTRILVTCVEQQVLFTCIVSISIGQQILFTRTVKCRTIVFVYQNFSAQCRTTFLFLPMIERKKENKDHLFIDKCARKVFMYPDCIATNVRLQILFSSDK